MIDKKTKIKRGHKSPIKDSDERTKTLDLKRGKVKIVAQAIHDCVELLAGNRPQNHGKKLQILKKNALNLNIKSLIN